MFACSLTTAAKYEISTGKNNDICDDICDMLGRTMAGLMWGIASDRYGRRLCLLLSMVNIAIFGVLLGFSTSFTMAVLLRLAIGLGELRAISDGHS